MVLIISEFTNYLRSILKGEGAITQANTTFILNTPASVLLKGHKNELCTSGLELQITIVLTG